MTFLSLMEARDYPFWASQFHPEKLAYEWTLKYPKIPHDDASIEAAAFFARFFVQQARYTEMYIYFTESFTIFHLLQARKNFNRFPTRHAEEASLIYNFSPEYVGKEGIDDSMQQIYLFDN